MFCMCFKISNSSTVIQQQQRETFDWRLNSQLKYICWKYSFKYNIITSTGPITYSTCIHHQWRRVKWWVCLTLLKKNFMNHCIWEDYCSKYSLTLYWGQLFNGLGNPKFHKWNEVISLETKEIFFYHLLFWLPLRQTQLQPCNLRSLLTHTQQKLQLKGSMEGRRMYLFRYDFLSCSESTKIRHDSFCVKKCPYHFSWNCADMLQIKKCKTLFPAITSTTNGVQDFQILHSCPYCTVQKVIYQYLNLLSVDFITAQQIFQHLSG